MKLCCRKRIDLTASLQQVGHLVAMMNGLYKFLLFHVLAFLGRNELGSAIIGGRKAPDKSMRYMASVQNKENQHLCGGFLVCKDLVITVAHCKMTPKDTNVVLGSHNLKKMVKTTKYVDDIIKHPSYDSSTNANDIMFLKLGGQDNNFTEEQPIGLPTSETNIMENCSVAGWGVTESGKAPVDDLRVVDVSVTSCGVVKRERSGLPPNVICADKHLLKGDFGGPLVCNGMAVGVASFCKMGDCKSSDIYSDISKSLTWIKGVLKQNGC
ncbi:duodenase-1 [Etheostoma spectabile]|uniref:duodenase-1 n=1 Tax=Etheostoma spectabile TaxID=54343 RepID=UPI0013AF3B99|nr:duodenase-1-like [Etheostoma spectabile]